MKSPQDIIKEREELFEKKFEDLPNYIYKYPEKIMEDIKSFNNQTLHALLDALIEREEMRIHGIDKELDEYNAGYLKAKLETIDYLKELKTKI